MAVRTTRAAVLILASALGAIPASAAAQSLGAFTWQLQPFCNRVTVTVVQTGGVYTMDGFDDQCRVGPRAPVVGAATTNPDGTIEFGWTIGTTPGGKPVHVDARIDLGSLGGPWSDSAGNSGALAFGADVDGMARPVLAVAPGTVTTTAIAEGAVTSAQIANGTIGSADVDATIQRTLSASCGNGRFVQTVDALAQIRCWDGASGSSTSTALGDGALAANAGASNTAVGDNTLTANVSGGSNTALGTAALQANVLGSSNTAVGALALMTSTATGNTAVGAQALRTFAYGAANTAVGDSALRLATFNCNTAVGTRAAESTTIGFATVAVGDQALRANGIGFGNVAVGRGALEFVAGPSGQNIAIGNLAGSNLLSGSSNI